MAMNDDPQHAWKCVDCGYVYGKATQPAERTHWNLAKVERLVADLTEAQQQRDDLLAALWQIRRTSEPNEIANIASAAIARTEGPTAR